MTCFAVFMSTSLIISCCFKRYVFSFPSGLMNPTSVGSNTSVATNRKGIVNISCWVTAETLWWRNDRFFRSDTQKSFCDREFGRGYEWQCTTEKALHNTVVEVAVTWRFRTNQQFSAPHPQFALHFPLESSVIPCI